MHMGSRHASAFCIAVLLAMVVSLLPVASAQASTSVSDTGTTIYLPFVGQQQSVEEQIVDLVNQQRQQHGCLVNLAISPQLAAAAYGHSRDMALNNFFSHIGSDGSDMVDRAISAGYSFHMLAENIQAGATDPQAVVDNWMNSPGHRANILNCEYIDIGVGYYYQADDQKFSNGDGPFFAYWTQDFGTP